MLWNGLGTADCSRRSRVSDSLGGSALTLSAKVSGYHTGSFKSRGKITTGPKRTTSSKVSFLGEIIRSTIDNRHGPVHEEVQESEDWEMYWYNPSLSVLHILFSVHLDAILRLWRKTKLTWCQFSVFSSLFHEDYMMDYFKCPKS